MNRTVVLSALVLGVGCGQTGAGSDPSLFGDITHGSRTNHALAPTHQLLVAGTQTCCITTDGAKQALYLTSPSDMGGDLHLVDAASKADVKVASAILPGSYTFSPDGKTVLYMTLNPPPTGLPPGSMPPQRFALHTRDVSSGTDTVVIADGLQPAPLSQQSFFTPSGKFFVVGSLAKNALATPDLVAIDLTTGQVVLKLGNGAFVYQEIVTKQDVMVFENTTPGAGPGAPPVEGLFTLPLARAGTDKPVLLGTHIAQFALSQDEQRVVYVTSAGTLNSSALDGTQQQQLATRVLAFATGGMGHGTVAFLAADGGVHLLNGTSEVARTPAGAASIQSPLLLDPAGTHVLFFTALDFENGRGNMLALDVASGRTTPLMTKGSLRDVHFANGRLIDLDNVNDTGTAGDAVSIALDGSGSFAVSANDTAGALLVSAPMTGTPTVVGLVGATTDAMFTPVDRSDPTTGALAFAGSDRSAARTIDPAVHRSTFEFSDAADTLVYVAGAKEDMTAQNFVGALSLLDVTTAGTQPVDAGLTGVSELGPAVGRSLIVNVASGNAPGIYLVTF
jgi:hypothetical protein